MPDEVTITFFSKVKSSDSSDTTFHYRTVNVVVPKKEPAPSSSIGSSLFFVFLIAIVILGLLSMVKPGKKTNRILNAIERVTTIIDNRVSKGKL